MALFKTYQSKTIEWAIWKVDESVDELIQISNFSEDIDFKNIKIEKRQKEFLCTRILIHLLFDSKAQLFYDAYGKPFIEHSKWNVSVSHSGAFVFVGRSKTKIGVDVEQISSKLERTQHKYCSESELMNIDEEQILYHLALHWSAKESVYKWVSDEALIFDEQMQIDQFKPQKEGDFNLKLNSKKHQKNIKISYQKIDDYVFTYCCL